MGGDKRWPRAAAEVIAAEIWRDFEPYAERLVIGGSFRRGKADVGDLEFVYIPKVRQGQKDLWGKESEPVDLLHEWLVNKGMPGDKYWLRKNIKGHIIAFGPWNKMLVHASEMPVDLFRASPENWGLVLLIRTGSADFVRKVMARFQELGTPGHVHEGVSVDGKLVSCPDEETVFRLLKWDFMPPSDRV